MFIWMHHQQIHTEVLYIIVKKKKKKTATLKNSKLHVSHRVVTLDQNTSSSS